MRDETARTGTPAPGTPRSPRPSPRPARNSVELRIHGVSGGQAEELLDVEPAMRVGGDRLSGFFRWRREPDTETVPGVRREIFAWGNLTSGRASRAFWLLLLPFMLLNVAYWMRPGRIDRPRTGLRRFAENAYGAAVRLLALSLTVLMALAAAGIGMDLVAWQCSGHGAECAELRPWLGFLSAPGAVFSAPGPALVLGSAVPVFVVAVLWRLSRRTGGEYEVVGGTASPHRTEAAPLSDPGFWRNSETMGRLRSVHVSVALGAVAALLLVPALAHDQDPLLRGAGTALAVLVALATAASTASVLIPGTDPRWNARGDRICRILRDITLVLLGAVACHLLWPRPGWAAQGSLPGYGAVLNTLFAVQCALVLVLLLAAGVLYLSGRAHGDIAMRGLAGPATAALGALLGGVFSAAVVYQSAWWLGGCRYSGAGLGAGAGAGECVALYPPSAYAWLQLAFTLEAAIALVVLAALALAVRHGTRAQVPEVTALYARSVRERRTWEIARARAIGQLTEALPACLLALLLPVAALAGLVAYLAVHGRLTAGPVVDPAVVSAGAGDTVQAAVALMVTVGSWLGGLALLALMLVGRGAYRDRPTRQALGAVWDVGTFWPRAAHPLAPPAYAERAVPQLTARVARMSRERTGVVLSGHSQGSVLAAATVWQLPRDSRPHVALLTHGSPLGRLYARYFPAYFNPRSFADLRGRVSDWRNLWRVTDAIAGPVRTGEGARKRTVSPVEPLPDPRSYDAPPGEALRPAVLGHSHYSTDPAYAEALWTVLPRPRTVLPRQADPGPPVVLPGPVGSVVAPAPGGSLDGRAHVQEEDQGGDQPQDDEHAASRHDGEE